MKIEVFSRRWGHNDTYMVTITAKGWNISHIMIGGECDTKGAPYLYENLDHESINYPQSLPEYMDWLWQKAKEQKMTDDQIQAELNQIGKWIQATEKASPGGIFSEYK